MDKGVTYLNQDSSNQRQMTDTYMSIDDYNRTLDSNIAPPHNSGGSGSSGSSGNVGRGRDFNRHGRRRGRRYDYDEYDDSDSEDHDYESYTPSRYRSQRYRYDASSKRGGYDRYIMYMLLFIILLELILIIFCYQKK